MVADHRVIVSAGSGGVGKTTTAAAIGLHGAQQGRRTAVLTIDPARRLADALGTGPLGHEAREVPRERLDALGAPETGSLSALMLDTKRTFDELVLRLTSDPAARERALSAALCRRHRPGRHPAGPEASPR